jgi:hypothetical protein
MMVSLANIQAPRAVSLLPSAQAHHVGVPTLSGWGTSTVDGVKSSNEYNSPNSCIPSSLTTQQGSTFQFCEVNDASNDYYYFQINDLTNDANDKFYLLFDNNHDGIVSACPNIEDALGIINPPPRPLSSPIIDMNYCGQATNPNEPSPSVDTPVPSAQNVVGAWSHDAVNGFRIEMSHPLISSPQDPQDYALAIGQTVGYCIYYHDVNSPGLIFQFPADCYTITDQAVVGVKGAGNASYYADITKVRQQSEGVCDLAIDKTLSPNPLMSPGTATVTLAVTNPGGAACAPPTNVMDNLPTGLLADHLITTPAGWNCQIIPGGATVQCNDPAIIPYPMPSTTISFAVNVNAVPGSQVTNCASVSNSNDMNSANNLSCVTANVSGIKTQCDLAINKTISPNPLQSPGTATVTLTITNPGGASCVGPAAILTTVTDNLPPQLSASPPVNTPTFSVNVPGWNCQILNNGATVQCTTNTIISYPLTPPVIISFGVHVTAAPGSIIDNCANVTNSQDQNTNNNNSCVHIPVIGGGEVAEICVTKFNDTNANGVQDPSEVGLQGWTITIKDSNGNIIATIITDSAGKGCSVVHAPGTYTVSEVPLPGWIQTSPPPGTYTVTVLPGQLVPPLTFGNQQAKGVCDLALNKTVTPNPVQSGGQVTITLIVKNVGGAPCPPGAGLPTGPGTVVEDDQPTGLSFNPPSLTQTDPAWICNFIPGLLCLNPNTLPFPYSATFTFTATVAANAGPTIQNCANVINSHDTVPGNNQSCVIINVTQKCIIATAAYGSELAAPVQFLRNFRDNEVQKTAIGSAFMQAFNNWYYSWAPGVAQQIAPNENYKAATRAIIAPLIGSLFVGHMVFAALAPASPELAILSAGLLTSAIIGLVYLGPVYGLVWKLSKRRITKRTIYCLAITAATLAFIATLTTGTFNAAANLTALAVVETLLMTPAFILRKMQQMFVGL